MADLFVLQGRVEVDTSKLNATLAQAKTATAGAAKGLDQMKEASAGATQAAAAVAASVKKLDDSAKQTTQSTRSLVQTTQQATQSLLGANVASIALGAAIGGVLQAAVMETVRALIEATTQLANMYNELLLVAGVGGNAAQSLQTIQAAAAASGDSFANTARQYQALIGEFRGSTVSIERVNDLFLEQATRLGELRLATPTSAWTTVIENIGQSLARFFGLIPRGLDVVIDRSLTLNQLQTRERELQRSILGIQGQRLNAGRESLTVEERTRPLLDQQEAIRRRIAELRVDEGFANIRALAITERLTEQLALERSLMRATTVEQETRNRLFQIELQLRQAGLSVEEARNRAQALAGQVQASALASQFQGLRDSLLTQEALEMQSFERRTGMLTQFLQTGLIQRQEFDALYEAEFHRSQTALLQIQLQNQSLLLNAQMAAGQAGVNVLQMLGQKSKVFAVAAIALNTALSVARAIQNTSVAATRALAELGPIAGPPAAAGIKAWGALEVASIIAAGALQGVGTLSGGGGPSVGSGGSGGAGAATPAADNDGRAPLRIEIEQVDPRAIFTGEQLNGLIDAINNQAENGRVVIASKLV